MLKMLACCLFGLLLLTACKKKNSSGSNCDKVECLTLNTIFKFRLVDSVGHNLTFGGSASVSPDSVTVIMLGQQMQKPVVVDSLSNNGYFNTNIGNLAALSAYPAPLPLRIGKAGQQARVLRLGLSFKSIDCCDQQAFVVMIDDKTVSLQPDKTGAVNIPVK